MFFFLRKSRAQVLTSSFTSVWPPIKKIIIMPLLVTAFTFQINERLDGQVKLVLIELGQFG